MKTIKQLAPLYMVIFFGFLGYSLTITLYIPMLMDRNFPLLPIDASTSIRATFSGLLLSAYPFGQFLGSPIIGNLSDHFGRKKTLIVSLAICMFGFLGMAFSIFYYNLLLLFFFSFLTGLFESNMAISQSIIADLYDDPTQKTKLIGYAYSACSLGYVVGPLIAGFIGAKFGYGAPFIVAAIGVLALAFWIFYQFNDQYKPDHDISINFLSSILSIKTIFTQKNLLKYYIINFLIFFSVQGLYRVVPLYVRDKWHPSLHIFSILIAYVSFMCLLANLFVLNRIVKYISTKKLLAFLLILGGLFVLIIVLPPQLYWIWLTFGLAVIPTVMALPTCTSWLSQQVNSKNQGQVLGNNQALLVLGESTSAAIGGLIAAIYIPLPIIILGTILLIVGIAVFKNKT